jgi:hypothetical protein
MMYFYVAIGSFIVGVVATRLYFSKVIAELEALKTSAESAIVAEKNKIVAEVKAKL